jgi:hypothetical protein
VFRYRLLDEKGIDHGPFVSNAQLWLPGQTIARKPDEEFEVVNVVAAEPQDDFRAYLVVRRI